MTTRGRRIRVEDLAGLLGAGTVADAYVMHDDDCPALSGRACGCEPEVELVGVGRDGEAVRYRFSANGEVEAQS